jgi:hypothetical protein
MRKCNIAPSNEGERQMFLIGTRVEDLTFDPAEKGTVIGQDGRRYIVKMDNGKEQRISAANLRKIKEAA